MSSQVTGSRLEGMELDVRAYARVLNKRKWIIIAALVGCIGLGTFVTAGTPRMYFTDATLYVGVRQVPSDQVWQGFVAQDLSSRLVKSYVEIVKSRTIAQRAIFDSGLPVTPDEIKGGLVVFPFVDTTVIRVGFQGPDPGEAQRVANAVAQAFVEEFGRLDVRGEGGAPAVEVSIIDQAAVPSAPISPNIPRNMALALVLGLMIGVGLAFLIDHLDVTVKSRDEIEALGLASLGSIPRIDTRGEEVYVERDTQGLAGEAFRKVRTAIGFVNVETPTRSILVTSAVAQEGKTTTAVNLATAYALGGVRTVLLEADLRRPSLHRLYGMVGTNGLTTAIVGEVPLSEAIMQSETRNLSVLVAGAIPPNPVELLGSEQMTQLLEQLERSFDVVIIDSPPVAPVADPATLAGRCDGTILVARAGKTDRRRIVEASKVLERAGARMLGVVLNFQKPKESSYEYDYYYGYRASTAKTLAVRDGK